MIVFQTTLPMMSPAPCSASSSLLMSTLVVVTGTTKPLAAKSCRARISRGFWDTETASAKSGMRSSCCCLRASKIWERRRQRWNSTEAGPARVAQSCTISGAWRSVAFCQRPSTKPSAVASFSCPPAVWSTTCSAVISVMTPDAPSAFRSTRWPTSKPRLRTRAPVTALPWSSKRCTDLERHIKTRACRCIYIYIPCIQLYSCIVMKLHCYTDMRLNHLTILWGPDWHGLATLGAAFLLAGCPAQGLLMFTPAAMFTCASMSSAAASIVSNRRTWEDVLLRRTAAASRCNMATW